MQLTYKTSLASGKPYSTLSGDQYLSLLQKNEKDIYQGSFGVYLARKVVVKNQELYQPLIDIDGATGIEGDQKIISAIQFAHATIKVLETLDATDHFKFLATGGTELWTLPIILNSWQPAEPDFEPCPICFSIARHILHSWIGCGSKCLTYTILNPPQRQIFPIRCLHIKETLYIMSRGSLMVTAP